MVLRCTSRFMRTDECVRAGHATSYDRELTASWLLPMFESR